jgi:hypothetical protein
VGLLAFTLVRHMTSAAEEKGHTRARIENLEKSQDKNDDQGNILPRLEFTLEALTKTVEKVDRTMDKLLRGEIELPTKRRSRAGAEE